MTWHCLFPHTLHISSITFSLPIYLLHAYPPFRCPISFWVRYLFTVARCIFTYIHTYRYTSVLGLGSFYAFALFYDFVVWYIVDLNAFVKFWVMGETSDEWVEEEEAEKMWKRKVNKGAVVDGCWTWPLTTMMLAMILVMNDNVCSPWIYHYDGLSIWWTVPIAFSIALHSQDVITTHVISVITGTHSLDTNISLSHWNPPVDSPPFSLWSHG